MDFKKIVIIGTVVITILGLISFKMFFSEEAQNKISRKLTTTFGTKEGCVELHSTTGVVYKRIFNVEKLSTAYGTDDGQPRPYRYGYGYFDLNLDNKLSQDEKERGKKYFEINDYTPTFYFDASK
jgi:hypothetical protein